MKNTRLRLINSVQNLVEIELALNATKVVESGGNCVESKRIHIYLQSRLIQ